MTDNLKQLPLRQMHAAAGAKFAPFAGYEMPIYYPPGVMTEHLHTRSKAGLFDVSHMGQIILRAASHEIVATALEELVPGDILDLPPGRSCYSVFLNEGGGIIDDLMITRPEPRYDIINPDAEDTGGTLFLVVNASVKDADIAFLREKLASEVSINIMETRCLLALQGPQAADVMAGLWPELAPMPFMTSRALETDFGDIIINRAGYTGEDGFEISVEDRYAAALAEQICANSAVAWIGLGARDSLRLEAGLCLYGHDLTPETSPVEGNIAFVISKRRRRLKNFLGMHRIMAELDEGPAQKRVGVMPEGRAPVREGAAIHNLVGVRIGTITSGGFGPSFGGPVAMGYVDRCYSAAGSRVQIALRGKFIPAVISKMPALPHRYYTGETS